MERKITEVKENPKRDSLTFDTNGVIRLPQRFAVLNRLITRDLNGTNTSPFYLMTLLLSSGLAWNGTTSTP